MSVTESRANDDRTATDAPQAWLNSRQRSKKPLRDDAETSGEFNDRGITTGTPRDPVARGANWRGIKRRFRPPQFRTVARWTGEITAVTDGGFVARLQDQLVPHPPEVAEFDLEDVVSPSERRLVVEGARVYWALGYRIWPDGRQERSGSLKVRRAPLITQESLDEAEVWATQIGKRLGLPD